MATLRWLQSQSTSLIPRLEAHTLVFVGPSAYVYGGKITSEADPSSFKVNDVLYLFDADDLTGLELIDSAGEKPPGLFDHLAAPQHESSRMWIFGGKTASDEPSKDIYMYDAEADAWAMCQRPPFDVRKNAGLSATADKVLLFSLDDFILGVYDPVEDSWAMCMFSVSVALSPPEDLTPFTIRVSNRIYRILCSISQRSFSADEFVLPLQSHPVCLSQNYIICVGQSSAQHFIFDSESGLLQSTSPVIQIEKSDLVLGDSVCMGGLETVLFLLNRNGFYSLVMPDPLPGTKPSHISFSSVIEATRIPERLFLEMDPKQLLAKVRERLTFVETALDDAIATVNPRLKQDFDIVVAEKARVEIEMVDLFETIENLEMTVTEKEKEMSTLKESFDKAIEPFQSENTQLRAQVTELSMEVNFRRTDTLMKEEELENFQSYRQQLVSENEELKRQVDEILEDMAERDAEVASQAALIDNLKAEHRSVTLQNEELASKNMSLLRTENESLKMEIVALKLEKTEIASQNEELIRESQENSSLILELNEKIQLLEAENADLGARFAETLNEYESLLNAHQALHSQVSLLEAAAAAATAATSSSGTSGTLTQQPVTEGVAVASLSDILTENATLKEQVAEIVGQYDALVCQLRDIQGRIQDLEEENAYLNSSMERDANLTPFERCVSVGISTDDLESAPELVEVRAALDQVTSLARDLALENEKLCGSLQRYEVLEAENAYLKNEVVKLRSKPASQTEAATIRDVEQISRSIEGRDSLLSQLQADLVTLDRENAYLVDDLGLSKSELESYRFLLRKVEEDCQLMISDFESRADSFCAVVADKLGLLESRIERMDAQATNLVNANETCCNAAELTSTLETAIADSSAYCANPLPSASESQASTDGLHSNTASGGNSTGHASPALPSNPLLESLLQTVTQLHNEHLLQVVELRESKTAEDDATACIQDLGCRLAGTEDELRKVFEVVADERSNNTVKSAMISSLESNLNKLSASLAIVREIVEARDEELVQLKGTIKHLQDSRAAVLQTVSELHQQYLLTSVQLKEARDLNVETDRRLQELSASVLQARSLAQSQNDAVAVLADEKASLLNAALSLQVRSSDNGAGLSAGDSPSASSSSSEPLLIQQSNIEPQDKQDRGAASQTQTCEVLDHAAAIQSLEMRNIALSNRLTASLDEFAQLKAAGSSTGNVPTSTSVSTSVSPPSSRTSSNKTSAPSDVLSTGSLPSLVDNARIASELDALQQENAMLAVRLAERESLHVELDATNKALLRECSLSESLRLRVSTLENDLLQSKLRSESQLTVLQATLFERQSQVVDKDDEIKLLSQKCEALVLSLSKSSVSSDSNFSEILEDLHFKSRESSIRSSVLENENSGLRELLNERNAEISSLHSQLKDAASARLHLSEQLSSKSLMASTLESELSVAKMEVEFSKSESEKLAKYSKNLESIVRLLEQSGQEREARISSLTEDLLVAKSAAVPVGPATATIAELSQPRAAEFQDRIDRLESQLRMLSSSVIIESQKLSAAQEDSALLKAQLSQSIEKCSAMQRQSLLLLDNVTELQRMHDVNLIRLHQESAKVLELESINRRLAVQLEDVLKNSRVYRDVPVVASRSSPQVVSGAEGRAEAEEAPVIDCQRSSEDVDGDAPSTRHMPSEEKNEDNLLALQAQSLQVEIRALQGSVALLTAENRSLCEQRETNLNELRLLRSEAEDSKLHGHRISRELLSSQMECQQLRDEATHLVRDVNGLRAQLDLVSSKMSSQSSENMQLRSLLEDQLRDLGDSQASNSKLLGELSVATKSTEDLHQELHSVRSHLHFVQVKLTSAESSMFDLNAEVGVYRHENEVLHRSVSVLQSDIASLRQQHESQMIVLADAKRAAADLQSVVEVQVLKINELTSLAEHLQSSQQMLRLENEDREKAKEDLLESVSRLESECNSLRQSNDDQRSVISLKNSEISRCLSDIERLNAQIVVLTTTTSQKDARILELDSSIKQYLSEQAKTKTQVGEMMRELESFQVVYSYETAERNEVSKSLMVSELSLKASDRQISILDGKVKSLQDSANARQVQILQLQEHVDVCETELSVSRIRISELEDVVTQLEQAKAELNGALLTSRSDCAALEMSVSEGERTNRRLTDDLTAVRADLQKTAVESEDLRLTIQRLEKDLEGSRNTEASTTVSLQTARSAVIHLELETKQLKLSLADVTHQLQDSIKECSLHEETIKSHECTLSQQGSEITELRQNLADTVSRAEFLHSEVQDREKEIDSYSEQVSTLGSELNTMKTSISNLVEQLQSLEHSLVTERCVVAQLEASCANLEIEKHRLETELSASSGQLVDAHSSISKLTDGLRNLTDDHALLTAERNDLVQSLEVSTSTLASTRDLLDAASTARDSTSAQLAACQQLLRDVNARLADLEGLRSDLVLTNAQLSSALAAEELASASLRSQLTDCQSQLSEALVNLDGASTMVCHLGSALAIRNVIVEELEVVLRESREEVHRSSIIIAERDSTVHGLTQQLATLEDSLRDTQARLETTSALLRRTEFGCRAKRF
eukprot:ANDGO_06264.mRNA.1 hypothetical protein